MEVGKLLMEEQAGSVLDFKDFDWKNATNEDIIRFAKTTDFPEGGIQLTECWALIKALESTGGRPLTIFETGMCYGCTTRIFIAWTLKYGGAVYSAELNLRPLFQQKMEEAGYWQYLNGNMPSTPQHPKSKGMRIFSLFTAKLDKDNQHDKPADY